MAKSKPRKSTGRFVAIPFCVLQHPDYFKLNHPAKNLILELMLQYNGNNNGDLSCSIGLLKPRGWCAATLHDAKEELLAANFIQLTRQGGRNKCSLYAVTWLPIDACEGKLDIAPSKTASRLFKS